MKSTKYYSLDECKKEDIVTDKLDSLMSDRKIEYEFVESDILKIKDLSLSPKEIKELNHFLHDNDVVEDMIMMNFRKMMTMKKKITMIIKILLKP